MSIQIGKKKKQEEKPTGMGLKLSIIVPIYKVEQYLSKCVDSLLHQDLSSDDYEIILVNDGSPDHCGEICEDYAMRVANIKVVHRENGGLSAARNTGIDVAKGLYIQFVDPDDYLEPNVLKLLVSKMEHDQLDVLRFNYQNVNENYEVFEPNKVSKPFVDYRDEVCDGMTFLTERLGFGCYAWQFMIRRELLDDCRFLEGIYFEDTEWTPRILMKANQIASVDMIVYNYQHRQGSITLSVDEKNKRKALNDKFLLIDAMQRQKTNTNDKRWLDGMIAQLVVSVIDDVSVSFFGERKAYLDKLKSSGVFPLSSYHATDSARRKIKWANISLSMSCFVLHIKNRRWNDVFVLMTF